MKSNLPGLRCAVLFMVCAGAGCQPTAPRTVAVYPVDGQILYQGKPASGSVVTFHALQGNGQHSIDCKVREDGHFVATQTDGAIGLPEGTYALTLEWLVEGKDRLAGRYSNPSKPLRTVQVESTVNLLPPIQLK